MTTIISGSSPSITFSDSTTQSTTAPSTSTFGFKNRIINGGMTINQRYGTTLQTGASGFVTDRFQVLNGSSGTVNAQTVTTAPAGFTYSTQLTVGTADTVVGSGDSVIFYQTLEGYNIADFNWGTANAKTVTLSFWVYSSLTGTYSGSLVSQDGNYSYPFNYTISSANTWEQKTVTITGPTSGTFGKVNDIGFYLELSLMTGSAYQGTPNSWSVGNFRGTSSQVNWMATSGNTWYVTGVQLEVGTQATSFDFRDYGRELILCQRYLYAISYGGSTYAAIASGYNESTTQGRFPIPFPVQARTAPTGLTASSAGHFSLFSSVGSVAVTSFVFEGGTLNSAYIDANTSVAITAGGAVLLAITNASAKIYFTGCEL
jgi:hypothetical protein